jgi:hypothetical protein
VLLSPWPCSAAAHVPFDALSCARIVLHPDCIIDAFPVPGRAPLQMRFLAVKPLSTASISPLESRTLVCLADINLRLDPFHLQPAVGARLQPAQR